MSDSNNTIRDAQDPAAPEKEVPEEAKRLAEMVRAAKESETQTEPAPAPAPTPPARHTGARPLPGSQAGSRDMDSLTKFTAAGAASPLAPQATPSAPLVMRPNPYAQSSPPTRTSGRTPPPPPPAAPARNAEVKSTSVIANGTVITGKVKTNGHFEVMGIVEGDIEADGNVLVNGKVTGNIKGDRLELSSCRVKGALTAASSVSINSDSIVVGDIQTGSIVFDGKLKGNITATESVTLDGNSYILGDISMKTISIAPGAVVNGQIKTAAGSDTIDVFEEE